MTPKIVLVLGTTYTGKSYAAGYLARHINRDFVVIVHTHPDESYRIDALEPGKTRWVAVRSPACMVTPQLLFDTRKQHYRYLYLSVYDLSPEETKQFLSYLAAAARVVGNLALFIEEAHLFLSRFQAPDDVIGFIRGARFYGVDVILVTHRLKDVDIGIRCVITHMLLFRTTELGDVELLAKELGMGQAAAERIIDLPDRQHLFVDRRTGYISAPQQV